jgi:hypothetical protein
MKAITDTPLLAERHHLGKSIKGVVPGTWSGRPWPLVPEGRGGVHPRPSPKPQMGAYIRNDKGGSLKTSKKMFNLFPTPA